ncbi:MAG: hypothetical protein WC408_06945 [Candidatus Micrarchaeia archaeon]
MSSKWLPEWLAANYFRLDKKYQMKKASSTFSEPFTFFDAKKTLETSSQSVQKTLWELEHRGFLVKRRDEVDYRSKHYQLISFRVLQQFFEIYFRFKKGEFEKLSIEDKLRICSWEYTLVGSAAAYCYHKYQAPGKVIEVAVDSGDYGKFIALLADSDTVVTPLELFETRRAKRYVQLVPGKPGLEPNKTPEGVFIEKIEDLITDLLSKSTLQSIIEVVALIVTNAKTIDWKKATEVAKKQGVLPQLGCVIEIVNQEARRPLVSKGVLERITVQMGGQPPYFGVLFPEDARNWQSKTGRLSQLGPILTQKEKDEIIGDVQTLDYYSKLNTKWGFNIKIPRAAVRKALDDLGVALRGLGTER